MNKLFCIASLALCAQVANAQTQAVPYEYGDKLDIAKLVSLEVPQGGCEVVEAKMTYIDSKGETHVTTYLRQGTECGNF
ncbi:DUF2790 domain-containing protein [Stutzerimonas stutzeri]|uniref:DUF2790 domain-containing protein n=1 Tax=Stutzerimonas sp. S1 TaxID=3030652 RepID=UPI00222497F0|nr:DUF2790 domain-containing protein [Stutzerimonas sp. S1]MCW3148116.1 DUF2790 domain-containing protein [Stutzerimonas sp. S1]